LLENQNPANVPAARKERSAKEEASSSQGGRFVVLEMPSVKGSDSITLSVSPSINENIWDQTKTTDQTSLPQGGSQRLIGFSLGKSSRSPPWGPSLAPPRTNLGLGPCLNLLWPCPRVNAQT